MQPINNILMNIKKLEVSSEEIKAYINSLNIEDYASLSTVFILGRSGWERDYVDSDEYLLFIEENRVNQQTLDEKFLTKKSKQQQVEITYNHELSNSPKYAGSYNHDWLAQKPNLIFEVEKGLSMLREVS